MERVVDEECMQSIDAHLAGPVVRTPAVALRVVSDARLARMAAAGSEGAMAAIFERHHQALHRYCYSILGNGHDAADALQNTMIKALRSLPGETREIALRPWLYRIAHNEAISLLRARRPDSDLDAAANVSDMAAAGAVDAREQLRSLGDDLRELTERQRGALLMRELGGLSFGEVAEALGTTTAAVKQSVYEARRALQALEEGRAMDCDAVRRTLSDGDRRVLRGMRMRGHLRACAGCHDFEVALRARPAQLAAMVPVLPAAAGAAMLQGILGGGAGTGTGGGLLSASLAGTAKATSALSVGVKSLGAVAATATLAGGAAIAVPAIDKPGAARSAPAGATDAATRASNAAAASGALERARAVAAARGADDRDAPSRAGGSTLPGGAAGLTSAQDAPAAANGRGADPPRATPARGPSSASAAHGKPASPARGKPAAAAGRVPAAHANRPSSAGTSRKPDAVPAATPAGRPTATPATGQGSAHSPATGRGQIPAHASGSAGTPATAASGASPAAAPDAP